jgi:UDP-glucose 4-epimerase
MNVLVTGGAGYIGSHTVHALLERGHRVTALDSLLNGHRCSIPAETLVQGDIADGVGLAQTLAEREIEAVVHCAALADVPDSVARPGPYFENNVAKGIAFLEILRETGVRKVVFSSSAAVYGDPERNPIEEADPKRPKNPYGLTKLMFEQMLDWYGKSYVFGHVSLRYFCAAGAAPNWGIGEDHRPERHLIPSVLLAALGERPEVQIYGTDYPTDDGTAVRDYIHVLDLVEAHVLALEHLANGGESLELNVGLGRGFTVKQVIETAGLVTGRDVPSTTTGRRPGDPAELVASPAAIKSKLGWRPKYESLEEIIESAWQWHSKRPKGFEE